jgi:hypothetical protein
LTAFRLGCMVGNMIGREELRQAFHKVNEMSTDSDLPWSKFMESQGFDPNVVLEVAHEHRQTMETFGLKDLDISFGAGFTLAVVALSLEEGK